jgi:hypothetical protein
MTGMDHHVQLFSVEMGSPDAWKCDPLDLSLPDSWDYRSEPLIPGNK